MRQSKIFVKTRKEAPKDEQSKNASLLIRGGFIDKLHAGVYSYLPLGYMVLKNIENIIREELLKTGSQEIFMPSLHPKENWQTTGRWDTMTDLYRVSDKSGRENALAPTHEEVVVPLVKQFANSYKDIPFSVFQFQNKFRMELRAKSGVLRTREFIMKDMYSFHRNEEDMHDFYDKMSGVYENIFNRIGIGHLTYKTYASGGSFSKYSHEFQMITPAGEDTISICDKCRVAVNQEIIEIQKGCPVCGSTELRKDRSIEVGNIFELKTKFTEPFEFLYKDEKGVGQLVQMGCYGIGLGRVMGASVEASSDEKGIIWPESISPFRYHLVEISGKTAGGDVKDFSEKLYEYLNKKKISVLYDDRDKTAGEKFSESDLLGIPDRIIISERSVTSGKFEIKNRRSGEISVLSEKELFNL